MGDKLHFTSASYRVLGCRYAETMLGIMGIEDPVVAFSADEPAAPVIDPAEGDFEFPLSLFNPSIYGLSTWDEETGSFLVGAYYGFGGWNTLRHSIFPDSNTLWPSSPSRKP